MNEFPIHTLSPTEFPLLLREIDDPPEKLTYRGRLPDPSLTLLAVVGSRKYSTYGKQVVEYLIDGLHGYPVGIVSGLALGLDSLAHRAALRNDLYTLAVPGSGLNDDVMYPRKHRGLAREILAAGGGLLSEFNPEFQAAPWSFPQRNRVVVGLCSATLLVEANERSGTLISARLASEYNREVLVVPGSIFSENTKGTHQFLKLGATPVTCPKDILEALRIEPSCGGETTRTDTASPPPELNETERAVFTALCESKERDALIREIQQPAHEVAIALTTLELKGVIAEANGTLTRLR